MLNELLIVERGARQAGLSMPQLHPDVKECRSVPTIAVKLDVHGGVASAQPVPSAVTQLSTLRDGQHNGFPFIQPKQPLLDLPPDDKRRENAADRRTEGRRAIILDLAEEMMEASPTAPLVGIEAKRVLHLLKVALQTPAQLDQSDELVSRGYGGRIGEPVFGRRACRSACPIACPSCCTYSLNRSCPPAPTHAFARSRADDN